MALDGTYDGLKASIATWLNRDDLTDVIPDLIKMAETRLNDRLRLAPMEIRATLTLIASSGASVLSAEDTGQILVDESGGQSLSDEETSDLPIGGGILPDDFLEARVVSANPAYPTILKLASHNRGISLSGSLTGYPYSYIVIGNAIYTYPAYASDLSLTYYARIPSLSDDNTTNWLLVKYPQMYLYASLLESAPLLQDDGRVTLWKAALDEAISDAQRADAAMRWSNAGLRLNGPTP